MVLQDTRKPGIYILAQPHNSSLRDTYHSAGEELFPLGFLLLDITAMSLPGVLVLKRNIFLKASLKSLFIQAYITGFTMALRKNITTRKGLT